MRHVLHDAGSKDLDLNPRWPKPEVLLPGAPLFLGYIAGRYDVAVHEASTGGVLLVGGPNRTSGKYRAPSTVVLGFKEPWGQGQNPKP